MVVKESSVKRIHATSTDTMKQVIVDMVDLQALERLVVHALSLIEVP